MWSHDWDSVSTERRGGCSSRETRKATSINLSRERGKKWLTQPRHFKSISKNEEVVCSEVLWPVVQRIKKRKEKKRKKKEKKVSEHMCEYWFSWSQMIVWQETEIGFHGRGVVKNSRFAHAKSANNMIVSILAFVEKKKVKTVFTAETGRDLIYIWWISFSNGALAKETCEIELLGWQIDFIFFSPSRFSWKLWSQIRYSVVII